MDKSSLLISVLFLIVLITETTAEKDLYKVLGVRRSASSSEIKNAYRKLAKEW